MFAMKQMNCTADARFAPVCQSAYGTALPIFDTAVAVVSFLRFGERII